MIDFTDVTKSYGSTLALEKFSLQINEGEKFVLLGTSGSGKSTLLKLINKLIDTTSGTIKIKNQNIQSVDVFELRKNTGYVIQEGGLFPHFTVRENIGLIPSLKENYTKNKTDDRINDLIQSLKLENQILDKYPNELSGGQRQRVGIARALAANPDLLLFDEPLSALDPITKAHILDDFILLPEYKSKTIVWVTHDINEAIKIGSKICVLDKGRIQQIGTPAELLLNPANGFVKSFFKNDKLQYLINALEISDIVNNMTAIKFNNIEDENILEYSSNTHLKEFMSGFEKNSYIKIADTDDKASFFESEDILSTLIELSRKN